MEPLDEILKLLREIRDNQRELLVFEQQRKERSERRYREWKESEEQDQKDIDLSRKVNEIYLQSHESWLNRNRTARLMVLIFFTVFLVVVGIGGALAALGWIN